MDGGTLNTGLKDLRKIDVRRNIQHFLEGEGRDKGRHPIERYASFDYCYNYFQSFRERGRIEDICNPAHMQRGCLELGFYLASWGMLRGSSFLLEKSAKFYERLLQTIVGLDRRVWEVDVDSYTDEHLNLLMDARDAIRNALGKENRSSDTLVSKIMLGVFGNIPAFDNFFCRGFEVGLVTRKNLRRVAEFYQHHRDVIDSYAIYTFDFSSGKETRLRYSKAKIVDMVGFMEGQVSVPADNRGNMGSAP